jgi:hypothetical protein
MRNAFLVAVSECAPDVCTDLHGEPLALYKKLAAERGLLLWQYLNQRRDKRRARPDDDEALKLLRASIERWASKRHIHTEWCVESAYRTLQVWTVATKPEMRLHGLDWSSIQDSPPELPSYHPQIQSRESYIASVSAALEAYCDAVESGQTSDQMEKRGTLQTHLEWTVKKYCLGRSYYSITKEPGAPRNVSSVSRAVHGIAGLIGLPAL